MALLSVTGMGATASLSVTTVTVEPGQTATIEVLVRNTGAVVDELSLRVLGEPGEWAVVEPGSLSLFPQTEGTALVRLSPPRASSPQAGTRAFGVMVASREDPDGSVVEEGTVEVGAFTDTFAELVPHARQARRQAAFRLAIDNRGNVAVTSAPVGIDPKGALGFFVRPAKVDVPAGSTVFVRVTATPRRRMWRGTAQSLPFQVQVHPPEPGLAPCMAEGVVLHEAILPHWLPKALALAAALVLAAIALWYGLLRPTIRSQARVVALHQTAKVAAQAHKAAVAAQKAQKAAGTAAKSAGTAAQAATKATGRPFVVSSTTTTTVPGPMTTPTDGRVALSVPPGQTMAQSLAGIPPKKSFELTDIIFENPNGDAGTVSLMRGTSVVLLENLSNFRDLDFHFVSPISFPAGTPVTVSATCANPAAVKRACQPAVYLGGYLG